MNVSTSECSSGCESGWTMYLDQFSSSTDQCNRSMPVDNDYRSQGTYVYEDAEDEDLSMLSDASSGPPHFHHKEEDSSRETRYVQNVSAAEQIRNKNRKKVKEQRKMQQNFHLDDTASSPVMGFSKDSHQNNAVLENDKSLKERDSGYSSTHCKGKSVLKKHFGFFKPSRTGKAD